MTDNSSTISFDEAVQYAEKLLKAAQGRGTSSPTAMTDGGHSRDMELQRLGVERLRKDPDGLTRDAKTDADAYDQLRLGIANLLTANQPLPPHAHAWLIHYVLNEKSERPAKSSGAPSKQSLHTLIIYLIEELVAQGMTATTNDNRSEKSEESACHAVAKAMGQCRLSPSNYRTVKNVWKNRNLDKSS